MFSRDFKRFRLCTGTRIKKGHFDAKPFGNPSQSIDALIRRAS